MCYVLYLKIGSDWIQFAEFDASDNFDAFGKAIARLPREHLDKPMALEPKDRGEQESKTRLN